MTPTDKTEELMRTAVASALARCATWNVVQTLGADDKLVERAKAQYETAKAALRAAIEKALAEAHAEGKADMLAEFDASMKPTPALLAAFDQAVEEEAGLHRRLADLALGAIPPAGHVRDDGFMQYDPSVHGVGDSRATPLLMQAIRAAQGLPSGWPPIETAPKDQTWVLLYEDRLGEPFVAAGFWSDVEPGREGWYGSEAASHRLDINPSRWAPFAAPAQPAEEPAGITLTVEGVSPHFGTAYASDARGRRCLLNTGTKGIAFAKLKPGMRLVAQVNERNFVVSAMVEA